MEWCCGLAFVGAILVVFGHFVWEAAEAILRALFGPEPAPAVRRAFRYCPACSAEPAPGARYCPRCDLDLDGRLATNLHRVHVAEREVQALLDGGQLDPDAARPVLDQFEARVRRLQGQPAKTKRGTLPVAAVAQQSPEPVPPADAAEQLPVLDDPPEAPELAPIPEPSEPLLPVLAALETPEPAAPPPVERKPKQAKPVEPPPPPGRRAAGFLEAHNILWGELVGGLLIVGCSIALVVTLRQTLEGIPYFRFLLSAAVTLGLFGAGQYTLHRWKLSGTSRGMLVISMLLTPLTLLLLAEPFTEGTPGARDVIVKVLALAAFVGVARTGGRDLIGTQHLPGPVDRRWLLALAVVGAAGTQLLPANLASAWAPLACFAVATGATLGGLSWYSPSRRDEPVSDKSGTALLMFVGLAAFALVTAWGLFVARDQGPPAARLAGLAVPLALAAVPVIEAGVLVLRRVASGGLRTAGTAVALAGFGAVTTGLALAWPDSLALLLISGAIGAYLTRVAFREQLPWVQIGAIPLLAFATVLGFHGAVGNWAASSALNEKLGGPASGSVLAGFALALGLLAEVLARRASRQTRSYATGALCVGAAGLLLVSWHGAEYPATAAATHGVLALGLLASNYRWERRSLAHAGLWIGLVGTLWALWAQAPRQPDLWGLVLAAEAAFIALGAVALQNAHRGATALLRRAGRDVAFAACVLAVVIAAGSLTLNSAWHTGTLFTLALAGIALARLTGWPALTWVGSSAVLLGCLHLGVFTWHAKPETLAVETALLAHASLATCAALLCRRQARVFGDPFRWSARLSTALAVPLLFAPAVGYAFASAGLAVWLGGLWLAFTLLWRERGGFSAFQAAVTLAALLAAFGWTERQDWWRVTQLGLLDPRALHASGFALGGLAVGWIVTRRALLPNARSRRELWGDNPLSLDRLVLGAAVIGFVLLAVVAVRPGATAELTVLGSRPLVTAPVEMVHAFGPSAFYLLALLATAVGLSWRLSKLEHDADVHAIGLALLTVAAPVIWAGTFAPGIATASALRWGLAVVFVAGSALVALRALLRHAAERVGFAVLPSPYLRPVLLGVFATAAGVVLLLSALVAELGLSRLKPAGPLDTSVFAQMGPLASNLVPLALVVFGLATSAARGRSSGYALAGGLVFVVTLVAGYALAVVTAGKPLDGTELTRLALIFAGAAATWSALWQAVEWRVPGGYPLTVQVLLGFGALLAVCFAPGMRTFAHPHVPLAVAFDPLGVFGGGVLVLVTGAGVWHARRTQPEAASLPLAFAGLLVGVFAAVVVRHWDEPGRWASFHAMALTWAGVGAAFLVTIARVRLGAWWLTCFASLLVLCALRAGWSDPWRPWLPSGLALIAAIFFGFVALRTRSVAFASVSGLAVNLAVVLVWVSEGPDSAFGFCLANAAGLGVAVAVWARVRLRRDAAWLAPLEGAILPAFAFLLLGLAPTLAGLWHNPPLLTWGALSAVALACAVGLRDRAAAFSRPGLFAAGALAVLLAVCEADPRAVWEVPATALALSAYALATAALSSVAARLTEPVFRLPEVQRARWPLVGLPVLAVVAGVFGVRSGLASAELLARCANPGAMALLAAGFAVLGRVYPGSTRRALRTTSAALFVWCLASTGWAIPDPHDPHVWLHRNAWLFVALALATIGGSLVAARFPEGWQRAVRAVVGWAAVAAVAALCVNLLQQVPVFDPGTRRTPLGRESSLAMLAAIGGLVFLALRFALKPERDPFELRPARRTAYVYTAEVLVVLFFLHIKFNVPELFRGDLAKLWTFAVMALAYAGIGLAELFERRKIDVLALPLRRTGVLLPLVPLLAFWAKPPAVVSEFARDTAPGLGPLLGYLEKLPQHFDTYAWLWFLAGGVYGFVALSKRSFGWALLAALATNAALWSLLAHGDVPFFVHPQAWVIPLALIVLVSEHINRKRLSAEVSNGMRYAGVAMIYVASAADMFIAGVGASMWLPVVLAVLCVLGVLGGILLRVRAFIYLGVGFLLLDVFSMIWHAAVNLQQTWVWYASGIVLGVVVLALFAYLEKRRGHADTKLEESE